MNYRNTVWRGDFATLWRPPPGWREPLAAASAPVLPAPIRAWVQERLADAGVADAGKPLRERLWAYQVAQGLPPDGRPSPITMMQLGRAASAPGEPALLAHRSPAGPPVLSAPGASSAPASLPSPAPPASPASAPSRSAALPAPSAQGR